VVGVRSKVQVPPVLPMVTISVAHCNRENA
jgi:hypothetical protein